MSPSKSTVFFKEFNENTSKCSAWLQEKGRCCGRTIVTTDQEKKEILLQSIARSRTSHNDQSDELAGLYFCDGWHRPGGKYVISSSQTRKLLQNLFPSIPEPETCYPPAARRPESPVSSLGTRESLTHPLDGDRLPLIAQPAEQSSWHGVSEVAEAERFSFSAAQPILNLFQYNASELSEVEMLSLSTANLTVQSPELDMSPFSVPQ